MRTKSLAFRYSLFFLAGIVFVFALAFLYVFNYSMRLLVEEGKKDAGNVSDLVISRVDRSLSRLEMIPQMLKVSYEGSHADLGEIERVLAGVIRDDPYAFGTCIAFEPYAYRRDTALYAPYIYETPQGVRVKSLATAGYNYLDKPWYRIPKETGQAMWSEPYYDVGGGDTLMCTYSVPFYREIRGKQRFQGVITVDISLNDLSKLISSVKIYQTGFGFLVSRKGRIITFPDRRFIGKDMTELVAPGNLAEAKRVLASMEAGQRGFVKMKRKIGNQPSWFYYAPVASTGWSFGVIFPRNELFAALFSLMYGLVFIFLASIVAVMIVTVLVTRKFTKPIKQLVVATRRIGQGDFSTPMPVYRSGDEIAQLGNSFALMKEELMNYIENLRETTSAKEKIESELQVAQSIQMGLLPKQFPMRPELDLFATLIPARAVGGDLYDFFFLDDDHLFFAIGDVSGKGVPASLFMTLTRTLVRTRVTEGKALDRILERINTELCQENPSSLFVTFLPCILEIGTGKVTLCNAGHNPPVRIRADGTAEFVRIKPNVPLGSLEEMSFKSDHLVLSPGDQLILYTDGITEAEDISESLFGDRRLEESARAFAPHGSRALVGGIVSTVQSFAGEAEQSDDITILVLTYEGPGGLPKVHEPVRLDLENQVSELEKISGTLTQLEATWSLPEKVRMDLDLVLEELFTNIVFYAFTDELRHTIRLLLERIPGGISVTLEDDGRPFNMLETERPAVNGTAEEREIGGLGIHLVRELMDRVEYTRDGARNRLVIHRYFKQNVH